MTCNRCKMYVKKKWLFLVQGVAKAQVDLKRGTLSVDAEELAVPRIKLRLKEAGYAVVS